MTGDAAHDAERVEIARSYDAIAHEYVARIHDELDAKPYDRAWLEDVAGRVSAAGGGLVCEVGCGPGHVGRFVHDAGCDAVLGVDVSPEMIAQARRLHPMLRFEVGDMRVLRMMGDGEAAAMVAFYAWVNLSDEARIAALRAAARVLRPGGLLTAAYHRGAGEVERLDAWWGHEVALDFHLLDPAQVRAEAEAAGFETIRDEARAPIPDAEHPTDRAYQLFRRRDD